MEEPITKLYYEITDKTREIRRIGIDFCELHDKGLEQYDIFTDLERVRKEKKLVESVLAIKEKFGKNSMLKGIDFQENATQRERNKLIGGHNSGES